MQFGTDPIHILLTYTVHIWQREHNYHVKHIAKVIAFSFMFLLIKNDQETE